jgi:hypothetical protein
MDPQHCLVQAIIRTQFCKIITYKDSSGRTRLSIRREHCSFTNLDLSRHDSSVVDPYPVMHDSSVVDPDLVIPISTKILRTMTLLTLKVIK